MSWDVGSWVIDTVNSVLGTLIKTHGTQTFTEDGTFTVPAGVTKILVTAFGAGGGGGRYDASGGQGGDRVIKKVYSVVSGTVIPITIGKGGAGAKASDGAKGNDGGATVIGNLITLEGGGGGTSKSHRGSPGGSAAMNGMDSPMANGGLKGSDAYYSDDDTYEGGGGGGAGFGRGGNGGYAATGEYAGDGLAGGIGAGGGAGGRSADGGKYHGDGGKGGDGIVIIEW